MTATPLNIDEGTFSISNHPIASMVQSYIHMQPEVEYALSSVVEEKARRHLLYKIHRAKSMSEKLAGRSGMTRRFWIPPWMLCIVNAKYECRRCTGMMHAILFLINPLTHKFRPYPTNGLILTEWHVANLFKKPNVATFDSTNLDDK
ncbi:hypothetical protein PHYBLDRAFT_152560 [Phycomyces blakesleeanus NRRL 1555(-)]|uniref:Uncharacterized protein n=1 Tax=Phycomyces blakesleeanus (strain ATCC 8743b / DSM 1359 / FGSC 10004 / NBRC 33097 / NRRL 1555) TaxID=763407 RepID=A0A167JL88_PHYB8|nr:hypothetical protein PHYBLDRAFT_152560 [Phycomyces blakesleeanus NRRL 1555(-)]OAD66236.1 hypothetical protein PHYBLDRAFT_152560 [Phycomyces blakesleeanus NRRL 1555(-)]|eukprot:XP_018284276.1 hypothetical protein PHYBLDRAFT_152560 [Phycomyces blakesleeanus NRRL 1555(-)]